jgi:chromosome segregation and condensation protein ScpB
MLSIEREKLLRGNISQAFGLGLHLLHRHRDPLSDTNRVEATIFAASEPVTRSVLARVVGRECNLDLLIDDIRAELAGRPYDLVAVAGGFRHLTRPAYADAIRSAFG